MHRNPDVRQVAEMPSILTYAQHRLFIERAQQLDRKEGIAIGPLVQPWDEAFHFSGSEVIALGDQRADIIASEAAQSQTRGRCLALEQGNEGVEGIAARQFVTSVGD